MNSNIKDNLFQIQEVATKALEEHKNSTERWSGINYLDLRVIDVWVKYSIHDEDLEYGVLIEEWESNSSLHKNCVSPPLVPK